MKQRKGEDISAEKLSSLLRNHVASSESAYILDIDLDFFSTRDPFRGLYPKADIYQDLQKLYYYQPPTNRDVTRNNLAPQDQNETAKFPRLIPSPEFRFDTGGSFLMRSRYPHQPFTKRLIESDRRKPWQSNTITRTRKMSTLSDVQLSMHQNPVGTLETLPIIPSFRASHPE
ncbi:hypothetical protein J437_LFUL006696 [Ladona fulva]|uniref:Uncharacterized protein n=1 Tax=Ladona fulva TaxID=123851 RepID=A0A8K0NX27_LADFU|nr:hypothetical protein J437_LFUL006696 [Ladona fulva]